MSHVVGIKTSVKDLGALKRAAEALGLEFMEGQSTHKWFGHFMGEAAATNSTIRLAIKAEDYGQCLHAIRMKGNSDAYEIGVVRNPKGEGYIMIFDFFAQQRNITAICGEDLRKLLKEYEYQVVAEDPGIQELLNQGYHIQKDIQENGDIRVVVTNEL
jgi:hypothetical protein